MRVLGLARYGRMAASSRMRIYQYVPLLRELGIDIQVAPLLRDNYLLRLYAGEPENWREIAGDYLTRLTKLLRAGKFDLLWIEKEIFPTLPAFFERALRCAGIRYVVDYDDAIFHNYDLSRHRFKKLLARKIDQVMRGAALVLCGNDYLAERARSAGSSRVEIVPTVVDLERYSIVPTSARKDLVVGWIGSPSTMKYLEFAIPIIKTLSAECAVRLHVIGPRIVSAEIDVDCRTWKEDSEVAEIQEFDVGIMPLADSPWERGKCGYKLIQYMACGKPVIASPVGTNRQIVLHGVNGYLASTSEEWLSAFRSLCADPDLRRRMGQQGRLAVEQKYCLQVTAPRLARLLHETASRSIP